ncbi:unnamed protein product [Trichobilharzia szidati]|nr:unnamed protein product [Trichobilharzia szidati]
MTVIGLNRGLEEKFDLFCSAATFESILAYFYELCDGLVSKPTKQSWNIFHELSVNLKSYWKAAALFSKLEKRVKMEQYHHQTVCRDMNVLVIGCGPCGMRCAIELALLGARVIIIEKRHTFSRNNVLHLWPYLIEDLKALGAKTFFGKFCAGSIDHISIRTLQCILLKVALLFGVQVFPGTTYTSLIEPSFSKDSISPQDSKFNLSGSQCISIRNTSLSCADDRNNNHNTDTTSITTTTIADDNNNNNAICSVNISNGSHHFEDNFMQEHANGNKENKEYWHEKVKRYGWRVKLKPEVQVLKNFHFDVLIGADGKRSCLGFPCKELRCRLAIAITANFTNYHTPAEAQVEEISGVARIFNQSFFSRLASETGIDLENIVYYKDETHYFVMTAKKHSLLAKGVLKQDRDDSVSLLCKDNVDKLALQAYARETASYVTNGALTRLDFALNSRGEPDVDAFDFTKMFAAEHSCNILEKNHCLLLQCLIGDGLYEPFWPTGSGCALGFMSALDAAWSVSLLASGLHPLQVIAQRESVYQHLSHTTAQNMPPNFQDYTLDPMTRYQRCDLNLISPKQVHHLYITDRDISDDIRLLKNGIDYSVLNERHPTAMFKYWMRPEHYEQRNFYTNPVDSCLIRWFQIRLSSYLRSGLIDPISDLNASNWKCGRNLLCLIHRYHPELLPNLMDTLEIDDRDGSRTRHSDDQTNSSRLTLACNLMADHFSIYFGAKIDSHRIAPIQHCHPVGYDQKKSIICPKTNSDWLIYLYSVYRVFNQLKLPASNSTTSGRPLIKSSSAVDGYRSRQPNRSSSDRVNLRNKTSGSDSKHKHDQATGSLFTNASRSQSQRENLNGIVERGLIGKRREELVAMLSGHSSSTKHRPSSLGMKFAVPDKELRLLTKRTEQCQSVLQKQFQQQQQQQRRPIRIEHATKNSPSPVRIPENVARLFAPRKGSSYCYICQKRLYQLERVKLSGYYIHKDCLRCSTCDIPLTKDSAKCVNSRKTNEKASFYCPLHIPLENGLSESNLNVVGSRNHKSEASLEARLQAGLFPFGPSSVKDSNFKGSIPVKLNGLSTTTKSVNTDTVTATNQSHVLCKSDLEINRDLRTSSSLQKNLQSQHKSAILAGLDDESDQVMGVVSIAKPHKILHNKSSMNNHDHNVSRSRIKRKKMTKASDGNNIGPSGDYFPGNRTSSDKFIGIRDEPAPGPDCFLTGHLGLPEVVRRANIELNTSTIWPESTVSRVVDHMRSNRMNLLATDEYFASSESESPCSSPYENKTYSPELRMRHSNPKIIREDTDVWVMNSNESSTSSAALSPASQKKLKLIVHSDPQKPIEASMSDPSLCTTNINNTPATIPPPFSSPAHQSRLAAKQRFCLEPPKPLTIDPLRFIGSRNQERTVICVMDDCSECVEPINSPTISIANIWPISNEEIKFVDLPSKVLHNEIPLTQSPHLHNRTTPDYENTTYESDSCEWLSGEACKYKYIRGVPLATPEDIREMEPLTILIERDSPKVRKSKSINRSSSLNYKVRSGCQVLSITRKKSRSSVHLSGWNSDVSIFSPPPVRYKSTSSVLAQSDEYLNWTKVNQVTVKEEFESTHISNSPSLSRAREKRQQRLYSHLNSTSERGRSTEPKILYESLSMYGSCENDNSETSSTSSADLASQAVILPKQNSIQLVNEKYYDIDIVSTGNSRPHATSNKAQKPTNSIRHHPNRDCRSLDRMDSSPLKIVYQTQAGSPSCRPVNSSPRENSVVHMKRFPSRTRVRRRISTSKNGAVTPDSEARRNSFWAEIPTTVREFQFDLTSAGCQHFGFRNNAFKMCLNAF